MKKAKITHEIEQHMNQIRTAVQSSTFGGINLLYMGDNSAVDAADVTNSFVTGYVGGKVQSSDLPLTDTLLINDSWGDDTSTLPVYGSAGLFDQGILMRMSFDSSPDLSYSQSLFNMATIDIASHGETWATQKNDFVRNLESNIDQYGANRQDTWENVINTFDDLHKGVVDRMTRIGAMQAGVARQGDLVQDQMATINKGVGRLIDADMNSESARLKAMQTQQQLGIQALSIANQSASNVLKLYQ